MILNPEYVSFTQTYYLCTEASFCNIRLFVSDQRIRQNTNSVLPDIPSNELLGKRAERLFEQLIKEQKQYEIIAKNIQIFENKTTIGEIDFLIKNNTTQEVIHLEFAYKFYIYYPKTGTTELEHWIGPNKKDTLLKKIKKVQEKQFPILHNKHTTDLLNDLGLKAENIQQKLGLLGHLFLPKKIFDQKKKFVSKLNLKAITGFWISKQEFQQDIFGQALFYIPTKQQWILEPRYHHTWFSYEEIRFDIQQIIAKEKSPLIWMHINGDFKRFFILWFD